MNLKPAFLDANVVVYATGAPHPFRDPSTDILDLGRRTVGAFITSAEVMQEVLNLGLRRNDPFRASSALALILDVAGRIEPLLPEDVLAAAAIDVPHLSARDRIHLAVMRRTGCTSIVSTDRAFDGVPGITRLDPLDFESWRSELAGD